MYRAIPVGNKACAERVRSRDHALHRARIQKMRPQIDTTVPQTQFLEHVKTNLKREQLLEERYHEIDRDNKILLQKMSDIMKTQNYTPSARGGGRGGADAGQSLNRTSRKSELTRITQENQGILRRIQTTQPVCNRVLWEDSYRRSYAYLRNSAEYPIVLNRKPPPQRSASAAALSPMAFGGAAMAATAPAAGNRPPGGGGEEADLRYVLKEGRKVAGRYCMVEMATDGRVLAVSAYDADRQRSYELLVNEQNHRRLLREVSGDYSVLAGKLRLEEDQLIIDPRGGPLEPHGSGPGAGSSAAQSMAKTA